MDESNYRLPHLLETLGRDQLQQILARFTSLIPFPFCIINPEGEVVVDVNSHDACHAGDLRFRINNEQHIVEGVIDDAECPHRQPLAIPLDIRGEMTGYVVGLADRTANEAQEYMHTLQVIADFIKEKAYSEYEIENLTEELVERFNEVNLIYDISDALSAVLDPQKVCEVIIEKAVEVIGIEKASIMLYDEELDCLYIAASHGIDLPEEELRKIHVAPGEGVSGKVFSTGKHLLIENTEESSLPDLPHPNRGYKKRSFISIPMRSYKKTSFLSVPMVYTPKQSEKKVMGVINMTDKKSSDMFTAGDLQLLKSVASQAAMSLYNIELIEEVKDAERVKKEMEIAQQIQMGLLPAQPPAIPGIELAGRCLPATQVGGDYYDFFLSADNKLGLVIADVSGHNVGAALMMAVARSALRSELRTEHSPAKILENTNLILYEDLTHAELFITMFYAEYDANTRILRYSNGGHNHPIMLRKGNCSFLDTDGMLIGMLEFVNFEEKIIYLQPDDFIIFYTDGVVEAVNEEREMFRVHRLCRVIEANWQSHAHELLNNIYDALDRYSGSALRSDDITVVVFKLH